MSKKSISQVIQEHRTSLLTIPGICGIGQGGSLHAPHITIYIQAQCPNILDSIPATLEGYPVTIKETGDIDAL